VVVDWKGRRISRNVGRGKAGKHAAQLSAEQIQAKLTLGDLSVLAAAAPPTPATPVPVAPTFRQYAESWLATEAALRCKASTCATYAHTLKRLWYPLLGALPLPEITRDHVLEALVTLKPKLGAGTIKHSGLVVLRAVLSTAEAAGLIPRNPAAKLGRYVRSDVPAPERVDPFTRMDTRDRSGGRMQPSRLPALMNCGRPDGVLDDAPCRVARRLARSLSQATSALTRAPSANASLSRGGRRPDLLGAHAGHEVAHPLEGLERVGTDLEGEERDTRVLAREAMGRSGEPGEDRLTSRRDRPLARRHWIRGGNRGSRQPELDQDAGRAPDDGGANLGIDHRRLAGGGSGHPCRPGCEKQGGAANKHPATVQHSAGGRRQRAPVTAWSPSPSPPCRL
jgi:hypothetical protein